MKWKRLGPSGEYTHYVMGLEEEEKRGKRFDMYQTWMGKDSFYKKGKNRVIPIQYCTRTYCTKVGQLRVRNPGRDTVSPQCDTVGTPCPRSVTLR